MKKRFTSVLLCLFMLLSVMPFSAFAQDKTYSFEYLVSGASTGEGCIIVKFDDKKITLSEPGDVEDIPAGTDVEVTIKAKEGSAITAVVYNGAPMTFDDAAVELSMAIDNYSADNSLKITYTSMRFNCNITAIGNGSAYFVTDEGKATSLSVSIGGGIEFEAVASKGAEIVAVSINGEEIDLEAYGKNETNKMEKFVNGISDITVDTNIVVTFSGNGGNTTDKEEYLLGDANLDKKVNIQDATIIQKAVAGLVNFSQVQEKVADVDADKKLSVKDATTIQKYTAGIITKFPANKQ